MKTYRCGNRSDVVLKELDSCRTEAIHRRRVSVLTGFTFTLPLNLGVSLMTLSLENGDDVLMFNPESDVGVDALVIVIQQQSRIRRSKKRPL